MVDNNFFKTRLTRIAFVAFVALHAQTLRRLDIEK